MLAKDTPNERLSYQVGTIFGEHDHGPPVVLNAPDLTTMLTPDEARQLGRISSAAPRRRRCNVRAVFRRDAWRTGPRRDGGSCRLAPDAQRNRRWLEYEVVAG